MEPVLHHGDRVIVDLDARPANNKIVWVQTEDGWVFRRLHLTEGGRSFTCDNPESLEQQVEIGPDAAVYWVTQRVEQL